MNKILRVLFCTVIFLTICVGCSKKEEQKEILIDNDDSSIADVTVNGLSIVDVEVIEDTDNSIVKATLRNDSYDAKEGLNITIFLMDDDNNIIYNIPFIAGDKFEIGSSAIIETKIDEDLSKFSKVALSF